MSNSLNSSPIIAQYFAIFDGKDRLKKVLEANPPFSKLNRVYIAFAWIKNGELSYNNPGDDQLIKKIVDACRQENSDAKILISSGYDKKGSMYKEAAKDKEKFAKSVVKFIEDNQLDGYDMDWENGIDSTDMNNLLSAVRGAFSGTDYILTLATWPNSSAYDNIPQIAEYVDEINIMTYGKNRPLDDFVPGYNNAGMPNNKIIGGIETEKDYGEAGGPDTLGEFGTIRQKCDYTKQNGLAGMMEWRLDNDYTNNEGIPSFNGAYDLYQYLK